MIEVRLAEKAADYILSYLGKRPYEEVYQMIALIVKGRVQLPDPKEVKDEKQENKSSSVHEEQCESADQSA